MNDHQAHDELQNQNQQQQLSLLLQQVVQQEQGLVCLQTLSTVVTNLLKISPSSTSVEVVQEPSEASQKYKQLKHDNPHIQRKIIQVPYGPQLLEYIGFQFKQDERLWIYCAGDGGGDSSSRTNNTGSSGDPIAPPPAVSTRTNHNRDNQSQRLHLEQIQTAIARILHNTTQQKSNFATKMEQKVQALEAQKNAIIHTATTPHTSIDRQWKAILPGIVTTATTANDPTPSNNDKTLIQEYAQRRRAQIEQSQQFQTKALRQYQQQQRTKVYTQCLLTICFPNINPNDHHHHHHPNSIQGIFAPHETIQQVIESVQHDCLRPFVKKILELYVTPPRQVLTPTATLQELGLVPAAKVYVRWLEPPQHPHTNKNATSSVFLQDYLLTAGSTTSSSTVSAPTITSTTSTPSTTVSFPKGIPLVNETTSTTTTAPPAKKTNDTQKKRKNKEDLLKRMMGGS